MNKLTGLKDVDREVLKHVDDRDLLKFCRVDRRFWNEVCDDNFLRRRLGKYPGIEKYKREDESWKQFFLRVIYRIARMKERFQFEYIGGDFEMQYLILDMEGSMGFILNEAAERGEFPLILYAIKNGVNLQKAGTGSLYSAAKYGHLNVVKYLVENGVGIKDFFGLLNGASEEGHIDIVKYLIDMGAPVTHYALARAVRHDHIDVVKLLIEHGAEVTPYVLRTARQYNRKMLKYLKTI